MPAPHHNPFALLDGDFEGQLPNPRLKGFSGYATGDLYYRASDGSLAKLAIGSTNDVLTVAGGVPAWVAPAGGGGSSVQTDYQASDLVITSNATLQDTDIAITLAAGIYALDGLVEVISAATPGMVIQWSFTGTETQFAFISSRVLVGGSTTAVTEATNASPASVTLASTGTVDIMFSGLIEVTVSGTFKIRVRQNTSSATSVTFSKGSWLRATKLN